MEEETKPPFEVAKHSDSHLFKISIRGWIVILVVGTVCYMSAVEHKIVEPLYTLAGSIVGYYFGQNQKPQPK